MPELPEAETIVRGLRPHLLNRKILAIDFPKARYFRPQMRYPLEHYLGAKIVDVFRHGKAVIFQLQTVENRIQYVVIRLGMTGQLLLTRDMDRHAHAIFGLDAPGMRLCFRDQRQFGRMFFVEDWRPIFKSKLPPGSESRRRRGDDTNPPSGRPDSETRTVADPLKITPGEFVTLFRGRRGMIKAALMSQQLVVGVGNIYADESLFAAHIHPKQKLQRLSGLRLRRYFAELTRILNKAIDLGGSSISDFVSAQNTPGEFQFAHKVYDRRGEKCLRRGCPGTIKRIVIASRGTHYCPQCQRQI